MDTKRMSSLTQIDKNQPEELTRFTKFKLRSLNSNLSNLYKAISDKVAGLDLHKFEKRAYQVEECATWLNFKAYLHKKTQDKKVKFASANFCKNRFCPMCQMIASRKLALQVKSLLEQVRKERIVWDNKRNNFYKANKNEVQFIFLTLTVKNPAMQDLRDTLKKMSEAWDKLIKRKEVKKAVKGFIRCTEYITENTPKGEAHPHFHSVLVVNKNYFTSRDYIKHEKWLSMWQECMNDKSIQMVNIKKVKPNPKKIYSDILSVVVEITKYQFKDIILKKITPEDFKELNLQIRGHRRFAIGGEIFKNLKPDLQNSEFNLKEWEEISTLIFSWGFKNGYDFFREVSTNKK